jgi:hypothetical protein
MSKNDHNVILKIQYNMVLFIVLPGRTIEMFIKLIFIIVNKCYVIFKKIQYNMVLFIVLPGRTI